MLEATQSERGDGDGRRCDVRRGQLLPDAHGQRDLAQYRRTAVRVSQLSFIESVTE